MTEIKTEDERAALTENQRKIIVEMSDCHSWPIHMLAADAGVPVKETRAAVRDLHAKGLADFGPLYSDDDDNLLRGRGYWLSPRGRAARSLLTRIKSESGGSHD